MAILRNLTEFFSEVESGYRDGRLKIMKKNLITILTVFILLGVAIFIGFCSMFKPFDGMCDFSGFICSIETDASGALLIEAKFSHTDEDTVKLKTHKDVKIYDFDGRKVDISDIKTGMFINVDYPLLKHSQRDGEYYIAKKITIVASFQ